MELSVVIAIISNYCDGHFRLLIPEKETKGTTDG